MCFGASLALRSVSNAPASPLAVDKLGAKLRRNLTTIGDRSDANSDQNLSENRPERTPDSQNQSLDPPPAPPSTENGYETHQSSKKTQKSAESRPKVSILGPAREPKSDQKLARSGNIAPWGGAGSDVCRFYRPSPCVIAFRIDFGRVRPSKIVLPPQWEHDF